MDNLELINTGAAELPTNVTNDAPLVATLTSGRAQRLVAVHILSNHVLPTAAFNSRRRSSR